MLLSIQREKTYMKTALLGHLHQSEPHLALMTGSGMPHDQNGWYFQEAERMMYNTDTL